jgi:hypothetical protein
MRCIVCLKDMSPTEITKEHVFPEAIGGRLTIKTVCKACNSVLGSKVDSLLTDHWLILGQRQQFKLVGKSGKIKNTIERGVLVKDPSHLIVCINNVEGEAHEFYSIPFIERNEQEDGSNLVSIRIDKTDALKLPEIVNKILTRAGQLPLTEKQIKQSQESVSISDNWMKTSVSIDLYQYHRAIVKIVYELACHWLGDCYLDDPGAEKLRNSMLDEGPHQDWLKKYPIHGSIDFVDRVPKLPCWQDETKSHIGFMSTDGDTISMYVRIFEIFEGVVQVSDNASKFGTITDMFVSVNPTTGVVRESSFEDEITRMLNQKQDGMGGGLGI